MEWLLYGPLSKLCSISYLAYNDSRHSFSQFNIWADMKFTQENWFAFCKVWLNAYLDSPYQNSVQSSPSKTKMAAVTEKRQKVESFKYIILPNLSVVTKPWWIGPWMIENYSRHSFSPIGCPSLLNLVKKGTNWGLCWNKVCFASCLSQTCYKIAIVLE